MLRPHSGSKRNLRGGLVLLNKWWKWFKKPSPSLSPQTNAHTECLIYKTACLQFPAAVSKQKVGLLNGWCNTAFLSLSARSPQCWGAGLATRACLFDSLNAFSLCRLLTFVTRAFRPKRFHQRETNRKMLVWWLYEIHQRGWVVLSHLIHVSAPVNMSTRACWGILSWLTRLRSSGAQNAEHSKSNSHHH